MKQSILEIRKEFPFFDRYPSLCYLDNAATTQKPRAVLEAEKSFYELYNANPLRGLYDLSQKATEAYESAREVVASFVGAQSPEEIIFTRNATESLNLIAYSYGSLLEKGDEIVLSVMEHHSNLIPWQQLAKRKGLNLRWVACDQEGRITKEALEQVMSDNTKLVAMTQVSNVLGCENEIASLVDAVHQRGAVFVMDGAQSVPHMPVDVTKLKVDFMAFSGHKMMGPMGIGVLYARKELLLTMPPFLFGGEMIEYVTREDATWAEIPHKFEAGTVNAAGAVGLAAAIRFYQEVGWDRILKQEEALSDLAYEVLSKVPHLHLLGAKDGKSHHGIFSFTMEGVHPHDIAEILNADGICLRAGHHCCQVLMQHMKTPSTVRASVSFYNTEEEIERLGESLRTVRRRMGYV